MFCLGWGLWLVTATVSPSRLDLYELREDVDAIEELRIEEALRSAKTEDELWQFELDAQDRSFGPRSRRTAVVLLGGLRWGVAAPNSASQVDGQFIELQVGLSVHLDAIVPQPMDDLVLAPPLEVLRRRRCGVLALETEHGLDPDNSVEREPEAKQSWHAVFRKIEERERWEALRCAEPSEGAAFQ
jgi:hypothetical protein